MNTPFNGRQVGKKSPIFWCALLLTALLAQAFTGIAFADKLVLISPHWEGIRYEFERAFKTRYQKETGRTVDLEWMDVGGSSETLRYLQSEFKNKPAGIGIDIFFGGGLEPYLRGGKGARNLFLFPFARS